MPFAHRRHAQPLGESNAAIALRHPRYAWVLFLSRTLYPTLVKRRHSLDGGRGLRLRGFPHVDIRNGARLEIGDDVVLNSLNFDYHVNMHSPVKLFADRPGARIRLGSRSRINGACLHAYESIDVGSGCLIAANTQIFDGSGHDLSFPDVSARIHTKGTATPIVIGDNVWIGANTLVLPGATIGEGSVIAAGSVVTGEIPPFVVAGGNPARVLREYERP